MNALHAAPALALLCSLPLSAQDEKRELWLTDYAAAKAEAKAKKLDILMDFTGSDWCSWCIKLKDEVFKHDEFKAEIQKHFVLVELDFPARKKVPDELKKQNEALKAEFAIRGYPTIMLVDADGKPFAQTGYQPGGPKPYLEHLAQLKQKRVVRDQELAKAGKLAGVEKAKALFQALETLDAPYRTHYTEVLDQIVELDAENKAGLKDKVSALQIAHAMEVKIRALEASLMPKFQAGDFKAVGPAVDAFIAEEKPEGENLQGTLFFKCMAEANLKEWAAAITTAKAAIAAAPESEQAADLKRALADFEKRLADAKAKEGKDPKEGGGEKGGKR